MLGDYLKRIGKVAIGTSIAQIIAILGSLLTARLYSPNDFGIFASWTALVIVISSVVSCRYETALGLVQDGVPRRVAVIAIFFIVFFNCFFIVFPIVSLLYYHNISWLDIFSPIFIYLLIPCSFICALSNVWQNYMAAEGALNNLSKFRVFQSLSVAIIQISIGYFYPSALNLCCAYLAGNFIGQIFIFNIIAIYRKDDNIKFLIREGYSFLKRYKKFPIIGLPSGIIGTLSLQLPSIMIPVYFSATQAGYFALLTRFIGAPLGFIGQAILDVFKNEASYSYRRNGSCIKEYIKTFKLLLILSFAFILLMFSFGKQIFGYAFGSQWYECVHLLLYLLPIYSTTFISRPLSYVIFLAEKQNIDLIWQILLLITTIYSFLYANFLYAIISYSLLVSMLNIVYLVISYRLSAKRMKTL